MSFKVSIVAPDSIMYESENVDFIRLPGDIGQLGILKRHTPLLSALKAGKIVVKEGNQSKEFTIAKGFAEVLPDQVAVLANLQEGQKSKK